MKNTWGRLIISSILIMGLTVPTAAFAGEDRIMIRGMTKKNLVKKKLLERRHSIKCPEV